MTVLSKAEEPGSKVDALEFAPGDSKLRVILVLHIKEGAEKRFMEVYEKLNRQVVKVPGHISGQLCQSIQNPSEWIITSEWESPAPYFAWVNSAEHVRMVEPMHECVHNTQSLRYGVLRESRPDAAAPADGARRAERNGGRRAAQAGDNVVRHAVTFTVKPGSERAAAKILAEYTSPEAEVDAITRLHRTSLFMQGNRVVRAIEVIGDLGAALRHVAGQPGVKAAEEALNPHLEEARDLDDPKAAREFFMRAGLPAVHQLTVGDVTAPGVRRRAFNYRARPGCGAAVALLLARQDQLAAARHPTPLVSSTIFQRDDIVIRVVDLRSPSEPDPTVVLGIDGPRAPAVLSRLVDLGEKDDLTSEAGIKRFLADCDMDLVTDRRAQEA
ncbi:SchA/CurD-like domain-containing protein [Streptantibioticus ferralitis]|uniref:SchA/CurD-like domain-containing protein n=1 Tax=Streptantibioticus ferralitis TaxID=236510 RepID=A0ABT5YTG7_9ACTN|nr:SchA/CurD-like domain-containing protein [Streptantibioticus ferralitis]MDF2254905.1 SchA/CurD-like domain-containing protein [Streptantibioticus ferralitis]